MVQAIDNWNSSSKNDSRSLQLTPKVSLKSSPVERTLGILLQSAIKLELLLFYNITSDLDKIKTQIEFHSKV